MKVRSAVKVGSAVGVLAVGGGLLAFTNASSALTAPIRVTQAVNLRPTPNTSQAPLALIPSQTSPSYLCFTHGQSVGGVDVWFQVTYAGKTGYYASYYDNATYSSNANLTAKYGTPLCGPAPTSTPTPTPVPAPSSATKAISWATSLIGSYRYQGLCLTYVFDAWSAAGVDLRPFVTVPIGANTYPVDIWGHFNHGTTGTGTPPAGALVFYASKTGNRTLSHVTLSIGGGNTVSSADSLGTPIHYETVAQHSYANYLGWWLPA